MKKLLIIHHSSVIGGAGISLLNLIKTVKDIYDVTVFVSGLHDDFYNILRSQQIKVEKYDGRIAALYYHASSGGLKAISFWHRLVLIPLQYSFWRHVIKKSDADLVIANSLVLCWFGPLIRQCRMRGLCFVRETFWNDGKGFISTIQRKLLACFSGVSFISEYDRQAARLPDNVKTFVNHNFVMFNESENGSVKNLNEFTVLYLGGISEIKGIELVVQAAALLRTYPDIKFSVIGEDYAIFKDRSNSGEPRFFSRNTSLMRSIRKKIEMLHLQDKITFYGVQKNVQPFFAACDVLICPISTPHQQRGIFEAGWYSKPVIATDFEQLHWAIRPGYNGEFFERQNASDLAQKILKLYHNPKLRLMQGAGNNKLTLQYHVEDVCNRRLLKTINDMINE